MSKTFITALLALTIVIGLVPASNTQAQTAPSDTKLSTGDPPQELVGKWSGTWDNRAATTAEVTIEKITQTEVSGKYKHSGTKESPPGEFNFTAPLKEKSGKAYFTIVTPSGRNLLFVLDNGKLKGEWESSSVAMKKK